MKKVVLILAVLGVALLGYVALNPPSREVQEAVIKKDDPITAPDAVESEETMKEKAEAAAAEARAAAEKAAEEARAAAEAAAAKAAEEAAAAAEAAKETAGNAVEAAKDAASDAMDKAADVAEQAKEAMTPAAEEGAGLTDLFTVEGFDYDKAIEAIDASGMNDVVKMTTKSALEGARDNPDLLKEVLAQARKAMGLDG
ncbi:hypothetical protein [Thalassovita sp.]|uniref:hypothetical protein n=1 Tax=Thalassovita sp. TaxID=1979401 RepID=UPI0029DE9038|nr:hypothetical protein [Thalassovita sp.]